MLISANVCVKSTDRHILIKGLNFHDYVDICIICPGFTNSLTRVINIHHTHFITQMMQLISKNKKVHKIFKKVPLLIIINKICFAKQISNRLYLPIDFVMNSIYRNVNKSRFWLNQSLGVQLKESKSDKISQTSGAETHPCVFA